MRTWRCSRQLLCIIHLRRPSPLAQPSKGKQPKYYLFINMLHRGGANSKPQKQPHSKEAVLKVRPGPTLATGMVEQHQTVCHERNQSDSCQTHISPFQSSTLWRLCGSIPARATSQAIAFRQVSITYLVAPLKFVCPSCCGRFLETSCLGIVAKREAKLEDEVGTAVAVLVALSEHDSRPPESQQRWGFGLLTKTEVDSLNPRH